MRYGVIVVSPIEKGDERHFVNLGDMVQTLAILNIYSIMGIRDEDVVRIELTKIKEYNGDYVIVPININLSLNWLIDIFPLPSHIVPVFIGLSYFAATNIPLSVLDYFRQYAPIGCRDENTLNLMRANNIPSYLFGCVTATLPKHNRDNNLNDKVYLVDVPKQAIEHLPEDLLRDCQVKEISHIYSDADVDNYAHIQNITEKLLESYVKDAKIVITSRLHCLSPCMAMGVPVVPIVKNRSPRLGWIDRFMHIYSLDEVDSINWKPPLIEYEEIKKNMIDIIISSIKRSYEKFNNIYSISYYFESREKCIYGNYYISKLAEVKKYLCPNFKYAIWGAGQIGMNACAIISEQYPNSELVMVIDSYAEGIFQGLLIKKPDIIEMTQGIYLFITTYSGEKSAITLLQKCGKREFVDYVSLASENG